MIRLIDGESLISKLLYGSTGERIPFTNCDNTPNTITAKDVYLAIRRAPRIEAVPVIRGDWIQYWNERYRINSGYFCSICNARNGVKQNFCYNCGADMREISNDNE